MHRLATSSALLCACAASPPAGGGETSGDGAHASATTAMLDSGPMPGADASSSPATITSDATDATSGDPYDGPKFDVPPLDTPAHDLEICPSTDAQLVDLDVVTPSGAFAATHAWWAWEFCCIADPWLVLAEASELEVVDGVITTPHVMVLVPGEWNRSGPYFGARDVALRDVDAVPSQFTEPVAELELLEPLDPEDVATPSFVGTFAVADQGWTISGSVTAPYCAAIETPGCPCE